MEHCSAGMRRVDYSIPVLVLIISGSQSSINTTCESTSTDTRALTSDFTSSSPVGVSYNPRVSLDCLHHRTIPSSRAPTFCRNRTD